MEEADPMPGDPSGDAWRSPRETINDTVWQITSVPHTFSVQKVALCIGVVLVLAVIAISIFRRTAPH